jgi:hypothetical protein
MILPLAAAEALLVSGVAQPINSQKADQLHRIIEQNDTLDWRFD